MVIGSGLLADWCLITWTLWQYLDYGNCGVAGGSIFADCTLAKHGVSDYDRPGTGFSDRRVSGIGQTDAAFP